MDFSSEPTGETRQAGRGDIESPSAVNESERPANTSRLMEEICERTNLKEALRQVRGNKGSAVFGEVGLRERDDAVVMRLGAAHHALTPPVGDDGFRFFRAQPVVTVERPFRNRAIELRAVGRGFVSHRRFHR